MKNWNKWHEKYDDPESELSRRLVVVQQFLRSELDEKIDQPINIISLCAGDGRDVIGVVTEQPNQSIRALLVEMDERLVSVSKEAIVAKGLSNVIEAKQGNAAMVFNYRDYLPAQIVLVCGVFGNISDKDVFNTISKLPELTEPQGLVIWTRSRREPDLTPAIREQFQAAGFNEEDFVAPADAMFSVGAMRYGGPRVSPDQSGHLFTFTN